MLYDYPQPANNLNIRIDAKYDHKNVRIKDGLLLLEQKGYGARDSEISMSGIQSKRVDIIRGTFRVVFKVTGDDGGSCASFFWYRDDRNELDVEIITKGDSLVSDTLDWTTHPAIDDVGMPIPGATRRYPLSKEEGTNIDEFREYRFDWNFNKVQYFLDGKLMHEDNRVPKDGGNLQLKLWADGNKWWSGHPSKTTVTMSVKSITAYFNVTGDEINGGCSATDLCVVDLPK